MRCVGPHEAVPENGFSLSVACTLSFPSDVLWDGIFLGILAARDRVHESSPNLGLSFSQST